MRARLFSKTGKTRGCEQEFEHEIVVGRDPANSLVIDRPLMSGRHARIVYEPDDGRYVLEDLESLNGTDLDGDRVLSRERLGHLHVITFAGTYEFFFQDLARCADRHKGTPAGAARDTTPPASAAPTAPSPTGIEKSPTRKDSPESTAVDREPAALPGFLARRADALNEQARAAESSPSQPSSLTSIEKLPAILPPTLGQRADEASAQDPAGMDAKPKREVTLHEKLPAVLPGILAQRADQAQSKNPTAAVERVQRAETLDLNDIEELITGRDDSGSSGGRSRSDGDDRVSTQDSVTTDGALDTKEPTVEFFLVVTESGGHVRKYPLSHGENLIGRSTSVQVPMVYPDLSRRHAVLTIADETLKLRDLGSRNRTLVGNHPLEPDVETTIKPGARLRFGSVEAHLVRGGE